MLGFKINQPTYVSASGALPQLIPNSSLPNAIDNVECEIQNGGVIDWITAVIIPSPTPQEHIMNISITGTFHQILEENLIGISIPNNESFQVTSLIITGYFTFQDGSSSYNASYYWDMVSFVDNYVILRFQKKDIVVDSSQPYLFNLSVNLF